MSPRLLAALLRLLPTNQTQSADNPLQVDRLPGDLSGVELDYPVYQDSPEVARRSTGTLIFVAALIAPALAWTAHLVPFPYLHGGINTVGLLVAAGAWLFGFPNPVIYGVLAFILNYIPYLGPACTLLMLLGVGLVTFPTLGYALLPPACFLGLTTLEGQIVTPTVLGRRLTLHPLAVFLAIAFWAWLWGPMGAFLAIPILIVTMVIIGHVFPPEDSKLPG